MSEEDINFNELIGNLLTSHNEDHVEPLPDLVDDEDLVNVVSNAIDNLHSDVGSNLDGHSDVENGAHAQNEGNTLHGDVIEDKNDSDEENDDIDIDEQQRNEWVHMLQQGMMNENNNTENSVNDHNENQELDQDDENLRKAILESLQGLEQTHLDNLDKDNIHETHNEITVEPSYNVHGDKKAKKKKKKKKSKPHDTNISTTTSNNLPPKPQSLYNDEQLQDSLVDDVLKGIMNETNLLNNFESTDLEHDNHASNKSNIDNTNENIEDSETQALVEATLKAFERELMGPIDTSISAKSKSNNHLPKPKSSTKSSTQIDKDLDYEIPISSFYPKPKNKTNTTTLSSANRKKKRQQNLLRNNKQASSREHLAKQNQNNNFNFNRFYTIENNKSTNRNDDEDNNNAMNDVDFSKVLSDMVNQVVDNQFSDDDLSEEKDKDKQNKASTQESTFIRDKHNSFLNLSQQQAQFQSQFQTSKPSSLSVSDEPFDLNQIMQNAMTLAFQENNDIGYSDNNRASNVSIPSNNKKTVNNNFKYETLTTINNNLSTLKQSQIRNNSLKDNRKIITRKFNSNKPKSITPIIRTPKPIVKEFDSTLMNSFSKGLNSFSVHENLSASSTNKSNKFNKQNFNNDKSDFDSDSDSSTTNNSTGKFNLKKNDDREIVIKNIEIDKHYSKYVLDINNKKSEFSKKKQYTSAVNEAAEIAKRILKQKNREIKLKNKLEKDRLRENRKLLKLQEKQKYEQEQRELEKIVARGPPYPPDLRLTKKGTPKRPYRRWTPEEMKLRLHLINKDENKFNGNIDNKNGKIFDNENNKIPWNVLKRIPLFNIIRKCHDLQFFNVRDLEINLLRIGVSQNRLNEILSSVNLHGYTKEDVIREFIIRRDITQHMWDKSLLINDNSEFHPPWEIPIHPPIYLPIARKLPISVNDEKNKVKSAKTDSTFIDSALRLIPSILNPIIKTLKAAAKKKIANGSSPEEATRQLAVLINHTKKMISDLIYKKRHQHYMQRANNLVKMEKSSNSKTIARIPIFNSSKTTSTNDDNMSNGIPLIPIYNSSKLKKIPLNSAVKKENEYAHLSTIDLTDDANSKETIEIVDDQITPKNDSGCAMKKTTAIDVQEENSTKLNMPDVIEIDEGTEKGIHTEKNLDSNEIISAEKNLVLAKQNKDNDDTIVRNATNDTEKINEPKDKNHETNKSAISNEVSCKGTKTDDKPVNEPLNRFTEQHNTARKIFGNETGEQNISSREKSSNANETVDEPIIKLEEAEATSLRDNILENSDVGMIDVANPVKVENIIENIVKDQLKSENDSNLNTIISSTLSGLIPSLQRQLLSVTDSSLEPPHSEEVDHEPNHEFGRIRAQSIPLITDRKSDANQMVFTPVNESSGKPPMSKPSRPYNKKPDMNSVFNSEGIVPPTFGSTSQPIRSRISTLSRIKIEDSKVRGTNNGQDGNQLISFADNGVSKLNSITADNNGSSNSLSSFGSPDKPILSDSKHDKHDFHNDFEVVYQFNLPDMTNVPGKKSIILKKAKNRLNASEELKLKRELNKERKRRWREVNVERNWKHDLRARLKRRACTLFGEGDSPEKMEWLEKEFLMKCRESCYSLELFDEKKLDEKKSNSSTTLTDSDILNIIANRLDRLDIARTIERELNEEVAKLNSLPVRKKRKLNNTTAANYKSSSVPLPGPKKTKIKNVKISLETIDNSLITNREI